MRRSPRVHCPSVPESISFRIPWACLWSEGDFAALKCWHADVGRFAEQAVWGSECHAVRGQSTGSSQRGHLMDFRQLAHLFLWYCCFRYKKKPAGFRNMYLRSWPCHRSSGDHPDPCAWWNSALSLSFPSCCLIWGTRAGSSADVDWRVLSSVPHIWPVLRLGTWSWSSLLGPSYYSRFTLRWEWHAFISAVLCLSSHKLIARTNY